MVCKGLEIRLRHLVGGYVPPKLDGRACVFLLSVFGFGHGLSLGKVVVFFLLFFLFLVTADGNGRYYSCLGV